jgi:hypothetical protein
MMQYRQYIASHAWRASPARFEALRSAGFRCRLCNVPSSEAPLHAHHRTYERLGAEQADDLTALCAHCHDQVTSFLRARRYALLAPPAPTDFIPSIEGRAPLFDASIAGSFS